MRQVCLIALVSVLAVSMGGCLVGDGGEETVTNPSPTPVAVPRPKPSPPSFSSPLTPQKPRTTPTTAGLVQSVPADAVVKQIAKGRPDPFSAVQVQPEVTVSPNPGSEGGTTTSPVPVVPPLPGLPRTRRTEGRGTGGQQTPGQPIRGNQPTRGNQPRVRNQPIARAQPRNTLPRPPQQASRPKPTTPTRPNPATAPDFPSASVPPAVATAPRFVPDLPKLPEPTLARGVAVTGVVEVGGESRAIVKVPNEPDRTVREGDRLLNGQVLVKRIDARGPTPIVILEQYGVEVARRIGEAPAGGTTGDPTADPGQPTASLSTSNIGKS